LSVDMSRFIDVWVAAATLADVAEIMEDERLWDLNLRFGFHYAVATEQGRGGLRERRGSSQMIWQQFVREEMPTSVVCSVAFL